jgi:three-Cys-motif partner protein
MTKATPLNPEEYEADEDGLPRAIVGAWAKEKLLRVRHYVGVTSAARRKYLGSGKAGATYIDLFCGAGRARVDDTTEIIEGSPLVVWEQSVASGAPFTAVHIADERVDLVRAAEARLIRTRAPVHPEVGKASIVVDRVIDKLDPSALHFAFLDPYGLKDLPFDVLRKLARLKRIDMLIHVSVQSLQRNLKQWSQSSTCPLDAFAPNWRSAIDPRRVDANSRARIFEHWKGLLRTLGMKVADAVELVRADENQPLYWLAFAARHELPIGLWEKISKIDPQGRLKL